MSYLYLRYLCQSATRFATSYWFKSIGRSTALNLGVNQNLDNRSQRSLSFGISMALAASFGHCGRVGVAGVPVKVENRPTGMTDGRGMLLVTPAGACRVSFDYPKQGKGIAQIDPLQCSKESAP